MMAYVLERYGVLYSIPGFNQWLHHNGFSDKPPKGVAHTFDEAKQQAFINPYKALKERCEKDASMVFIDAVHPT